MPYDLQSQIYKIKILYSGIWNFENTLLLLFNRGKVKIEMNTTLTSLLYFIILNRFDVCRFCLLETLMVLTSADFWMASMSHIIVWDSQQYKTALLTLTNLTV